jgi:hypothetical protein
MKFALFLTTLLLAWSSIAIGENLPGPNWNPLGAFAAAETPEARDTLRSLYQLARDGQGQALLEQVEAIAQDTQRPDPERDYVLHSLAVSLGDLQPGLVDPEVLEYLARTRSRVRIPHEENPGMGVPLYNIRAAAAGSLAAWTRLQQEQPPSTARYSDAESFMKSLKDVPGPDLAAYVREAGSVFDPAEREAVVLAAPDFDNAAAASVVIAELAPALLGRPAVDDTLFALLDHPELGASAALILGRSGDAAILDRLADSAGGKNSLASRRASLAIDIFLSEGVR